MFTITLEETMVKDENPKLIALKFVIAQLAQCLQLLPPFVEMLGCWGILVELAHQHENVR